MEAENAIALRGRYDVPGAGAGRGARGRPSPTARTTDQWQAAVEGRSYGQERRGWQSQRTNGYVDNFLPIRGSYSFLARR